MSREQIRRAKRGREMKNRILGYLKD